MKTRVDIIRSVCAAIAENDRRKASSILRKEIPFIPILPRKRSYTDVQAVRIFIRDGFIDRYSGNRLIFPGVLRVLSMLLPEEIPYHPNWKMSDCHIVFWELSPTIDHVVPISRGGTDDERNWVCTSMLRNAAKAHWTLDELGWTLLPEGNYREWDGLVGWYMRYLADNRSLLTDNFMKRWHRAASQALKHVELKAF
jgi:5-methylcytosine-specific restriction endonuclease McrA